MEASKVFEEVLSRLGMEFSVEAIRRMVQIAAEDYLREFGRKDGFIGVKEYFELKKKSGPKIGEAGYDAYMEEGFAKEGLNGIIFWFTVPFGLERTEKNAESILMALAFGANAASRIIEDADLLKHR